MKPKKCEYCKAALPDYEINMGSHYHGECWKEEVANAKQLSGYCAEPRRIHRSPVTTDQERGNSFGSLQASLWSPTHDPGN